MKLPERLVSYLSHLVLGLVLGGCASEALTDCSLVDCAVNQSVYLEISTGDCCGGLVGITALSSSTFTVEKQPGGFYRIVLE